MTGAIVHGQRPWVYGQVRGVRLHAVSAVTSCIGMVNVSGAWLTEGLSNNFQKGIIQGIISKADSTRN